VYRRKRRKEQPRVLGKGVGHSATLDAEQIVPARGRDSFAFPTRLKTENLARLQPDEAGHNQPLRHHA